MKFNMEKFGNSQILTRKVRKLIERQVEAEIEVTRHCGARIGSKSMDTADVWTLARDEDGNYRVVYILLGYKVDNSELTEEAVINSPQILENHEVLPPAGEDIVEFYIGRVTKKYSD